MLLSHVVKYVTWEKKTPHLLEPKSYLGFKSTDLLIREEHVATFRPNFRAFHSTTRSFCSRESMKMTLKENDRRYKGIRAIP